MKLLHLFTFTILLAILPGCRKEDPTPTYHKDIFRCKVNGVEWVATCPSDGLFGCKPISCQYYWRDDKGFEIGALRKDNIDTIMQSIGLFARPLQIGNNSTIYPLENNFVNMQNNTGCRYHTIDSDRANHIEILNIDTLNFIIEGLFEYTAINNCNDTVYITDGYFQVAFRF